MSAPVDPQQLAAMVNGNGPVAPPAVMVAVQLEEVQQELLRAIKVAAQNSATDLSGAEARDFGAAAKSLADAYVVLDPAVDGTGVPLQHQVDIEREKQEGALRLEEARAKQAGPAQKRRKLTMRKAPDGGSTDYEMEG